MNLLRLFSIRIKSGDSEYTVVFLTLARRANPIKYNRNSKLSAGRVLLLGLPSRIDHNVQLLVRGCDLPLSS